MFECDVCGLCCQNLRGLSLYANLDRGDGVCRFYLEHNHKCSIYTTRPIICRVDDYYDAYLKNKISKECYYALNYEACNKLKNHKS